MAGVTLQGVKKSFGEVDVIHGVDLKFEDGEFIVFVGPSGCGKSTLLRVISGLEDLSAGTIHIGDDDVSYTEPSDRGVAMVFQSYALYPHMTVYDNMAFGLKMNGVDKAEVDKKVQHAAKTLQLDQLLDRKPKNLSGGQRQRVAIGRAIVRDPDVFLFDEPLSNLDAELRVEMRLQIARLHEQIGATMIYVTHDQVEAMTMADRIVVLRLGHVEQVGTPLELYHHPDNLFVAGFIGSPPMNQFKAKLSGSSTSPFAEIANQSLPLPALPDIAERIGSEVTVGIRPEHAEVHELNEHPLSVELELVETLGSEALLHTTLGDNPFIIKAETEGNIEFLHQVSKFSVNPAQIKLFDIDTGRVLGQASS